MQLDEVVARLELRIILHRDVEPPERAGELIVLLDFLAGAGRAHRFVIGRFVPYVNDLHETYVRQRCPNRGVRIRRKRVANLDRRGAAPAMLFDDGLRIVQ